jgi:CTP:molybdopterin cytidylyltransferase MocA
MARPLVVVFHRPAEAASPPLTRLLATAREALLDHQRRLFERARADRVVVVTDLSGTFGERLAALAHQLGRRRGVVVLGSGAVPLLRAADAARLVAFAAGHGQGALTNNRYSSDVCAVTDTAVLRGLPPLPSDNPLPRWLAEQRGYRVRELPGRWRLGLDLDGPLDLALLRHDRRTPGVLRALADVAGVTVPRSEELGNVLADPRAELLVAGRTSAASLRWLERHVACRVRAVVEQRGIRAASPRALADGPGGRARTGPSLRTASIAARVLAAGSPRELGAVVATFADAAILDTRVLLADRLGIDERTWPSPEDRFASDMLRPAEVRDPWLAALTAGAADARVPVLLGGHTLVGPGLRLLARTGRGASP